MSPEVTVVGGGIVGLATAWQLALRGLGVTVLEAEDELGRHQTGHNSGVIHSGLYYRPGSLKALLCTEGRDALYRLCAEEGIAHRRTGKLVVAVDESELPRLDELERRGRANGLSGLERLDGGQIRDRFPWLAGVAGLWVRETGLVDYPAVAHALAGRVRRAGGRVITGARLTGVWRERGGLVLDTTAGRQATAFLVACAGLQADRVARLCGDDPKVRIVPFRGEYYHLRPALAARVTAPVYPVPDPLFPFLGVHLTPSLDGLVEVGPNAVLALARHGYRRHAVVLGDAAEAVLWSGFWRFVRRHWKAAAGELWRSASKRAFARSLARLAPDLRAGDLEPGGAGVRAQAMTGDGRLVDDFLFVESERTLHVLNAPSPAATAALAIGREIADRAASGFGVARTGAC